MTDMGTRSITSVAVLVCCHNRREKTLACLTALFANRLPQGLTLSVILVDDGSTDGTGAYIRDQFPMVEILKGDGNLYWNRATHWAFARAMEIGFDVYLWLNDDTILFPAAVSSLVRTLREVREKGRPGIVTGSTRDPVKNILTYGGLIANNRLRPFRYTLLEPQSEVLECHTMNGNCVLIPHEVAAIVGNLESRFSHALGDMDYGLRARKAGFKIFVIPGYVGICGRNAVAGTFKDRSLPLRERLRKVMQPKGLPPDVWLLFTRRHAGILWPIYFVWPYLSIVLTR